MHTQLIAALIVIALLTTTIPVVQASPTIEQQLQNAREATAAGKYEDQECQVRCYPGQEANFTAEMEKHGYDPSVSADVSEFFLSDRGKELSAYYDRLEAAEAEEEPNPYCDKVSDEYMAAGGFCHDRKDYSETTGLYTCNDGTHKTDWRDCKDATMTTDNNSSSSKRTVDDGYTYPENATEEEKAAIDKAEHEAWVKAGKPGQKETRQS